MKVLGFMASPRKGGNSDILLERFLDGSRAAGAQTEKINIYDLSIQYCQGCYLSCWVNDKACPRWQDDMDHVHEKMIQSDLLVFSSPVYVGTPPAKLLAFFERSIDQKMVNLQSLKVEKNNLSGKKAVVLQVNFFDDSAYQKLPLSVYERILGEIFKMEIIGTMGVAGVREPGDIFKNEEALQRAFNLGISACESLNKPC
jgi:multimeric flavodoxin WrbA